MTKSAIYDASTKQIIRIPISWVNGFILPILKME